MARLTPKQKRALDETRAHLEETGFPPTYEELAGRCGVSKSTVRQYLRALEEKGAIRREHYGRRSIELVGVSDRKTLPVVGRVAAGAPILAIENIEDRVDVGGLFSRKADLLLRVRGDSMTGAGILDGDLVAVRMRPEVAQGEIAVVIVARSAPQGSGAGETEATVKRVFVRGRKVRLVSEDPDCEAMEFDAARDGIRVVGKIHGVIRRIQECGQR